MMRIRLAGELARRFGEFHNFAVANPNEAIRVLCQMLPGFRTFLTGAHERGVYFELITSNEDRPIGYEDLKLGCDCITLVPVIAGNLFGLGGKGFGIASILVGVALVAFAFTGFGAVAAGSFMAGVQSATLSLGFGLLFTGVASLFSPGVPTAGKNTSEGRGADDAIFNSASRTATNGQPIPLLYGETLVSAIPVVSSYIAEDDDDGDIDAGYWMGIVSEGPIEGFASKQEGNSVEDAAGEDIYLDGLQAVNSSMEDFQLTDGLQTTPQITLVKSAGFHIPVGTQFNAQGGEFDEDDNGVPSTTVTRSFSQLGADQVTVRISVSPCHLVRVKSDSGGSENNYKHYNSDDSDFEDEDDLEDGAQNFTRLFIRVINGDGDVIGTHDSDEEFTKETATRLYKKSFTITGQPTPISVTVQRLDRKGPPSPYSFQGGSSNRNYTWVKGPFVWTSMDVTWNEKLIYPKSSLLALKFRAGEFSTIPKVQVRLKGLKVPQLNSNLRVSYGYSNNPAYVLLSLLTDPRFGAGRRSFVIDGVTFEQPGIDMRDIDAASFFKAAQYCDDHNITFNGYVNRDSDALELFRGIASTFQAQLIYAGGFITLVVDKELEYAEDVRIYSSANTIAEGSGEAHFVYEGSGRRTRSTAVEVSYIEPGEFYAERKVLEESPKDIDRYGYNLTTIRALGCTNEAQARRLARYTLETNVRSTDTVSFKVGPDGAMVIPGDIVLVLDPLKTNCECAGRIISSADNHIIVDRDITGNSSADLIDLTDEEGGEWRLFTYGSTGVTQKHKIKGHSGRRITVKNWSESEDRLRNGTQPRRMDMWGLVKEGTSNRYKEPYYRVQSVKENGDGTYNVIAIKYDAEKYGVINSSSVASKSYSVSANNSHNLAVSASSINVSVDTTGIGGY